ncbi:MAG: DNA starvation/stationary phase protection protein [Berryella intestinalis]|uniref:Dps family protein n=1 Tax=Berryella intestinalis TaxID=1531429 RepID=UPI00068C001E|nr:DNA starvation/stationary phase protection protein [Berryella intestinalis]MDY3129233.1 DNA starvation/stationary phase protection protein [Berryella intestinalis]
MLNQKLNVLLSDYAVNHRKLQNLHWYVSGHGFFQAHATLETLYDQANEAVDEIAELILMNGGKPFASMKKYLEASHVQEREDEYLGASQMFEVVKGDYELILADVKDAKKLADEEDNYLVSAALDELIASLSKNIWMISQSQR